MNKNQHPRDALCSTFQPKGTTLTILAQIFSKIDSAFEIQKANVGIRIGIIEIPYVPIFKKNE